MGDSKNIKSAVLGALALGLVAAPTSPINAQDVDEVIVTGSYIKQSPEDAPVPIDVVSSEELFNIGSPSIVELVKTLGVSSGVDGETNQFASNGLEGTANINLRGLGAGRNLVLLNGRRNVWSPGAISEQQQLFVDINMIPGVAINRIELLKDGAAATYGSDAISGVVNFITRDDFEGFELAISHKDIDGSDGDQDLGAIWGHDFGNTHLMIAAGYNKRNKLQARARDWAIQPYGTLGNGKAYTGIPNPGSFIPISIAQTADVIADTTGRTNLGDIIRTSRNRVNDTRTAGVDESKKYSVYQLNDNGDYVMENGNPVLDGTKTLGGRQLVKAIEDDPNTETRESGFELQTIAELAELGVIPDGSLNSLNIAQTAGGTDTPNPYTLPAVRDARCADFIGDASASTRGRANCTYNYVYFDNLIEEEERINLFATLTHEFDEDMSFFAEVLWGNNEVPDWNTSPSYPPQVLVDTNFTTGRIIPSYHPGLVAYAELYGNQPVPRSDTISGEPDLETFSEIADADCSVADREDTSCAGLIFFGRPFGLSGPPNTGRREYETLKLAAGFEGSLSNEIDYVTSLVFSTAERDGHSPDTYIERWSLALKGFGGPNCTGNTPGQNGCEFYNPFSNAIERPQAEDRKIEVNPDFDPSLANSRELREWMQFDLGSTITSELTVWDGVLNCEFDNGIGWAFGAQYREEAYEIDPYEGNDLYANPCVTDAENERWRARNNVTALCDRGTSGDTSDDYEGSGQFGFLAGATPLDETQDITAFFGELHVSPSDDLEVQLSARYEDYGGRVGESFDPKLAVRWQANDALVVRGSASTTFRGPTLNQLGGRSTTLSFVAPTGSFKAIDTFGNPNLDPESATTTNLGLVYESMPELASGDLFTFSLDYWAFDFEDPIIKQSFNDIISRSFTGGDYVGGDFGSQISCGFGAQSSCIGKKSGTIQRVAVNMINGPDIETDGFDIRFGYDRPLGDGELSLKAEFTLISNYDVGASSLNDAFDALNRLNDDVGYLRSIVDEKWKLGATYQTGAHSTNFVANFTGSYEDNAPITGATDREIEDHTTYDLHYNLSLSAFNDAYENSAVWVSIYNLTDEDPPFARLDLNYDPYMHNPFGRIVKVGIRHSF